MSLRTPSTSVAIKTNAKDKLTLVGRSRAGDGTCFYIPELDWMFDCGALVTGVQPRTLFLTHTHSDHVLFLHRVLEQKTKNMTIYLPEEAHKPVRNYLHAYRAMVEGESSLDSGSQKDEKDSLNDNTFIPLQADATFSIKRPGGQEFIVNPIKCHHRIACLGYAISAKRRKLKAEYEGLPGREIANLKRQGTDVTTTTEDPLLCYLGDTTHKILHENSNRIFGYPTVVIECSFIDDADEGNAERTTHMHWKHLRPFVEAHPSVLFVLVHFSLKYSVVMLRQFFLEYRNVHPMLVQDEVDRDWSKLHGNGAPKCACFQCQEP